MNVRTAETAGRPTLWKTILLVLAFIVNATLAWRLAWGPQSVVSFRELKAQHASLLDDIARYDTINAALTSEIRLLQSDDRYVEKIIRQRLNFVRENEILYLFEDGQTSSGAAANDGKN